MAEKRISFRRLREMIDDGSTSVLIERKGNGYKVVVVLLGGFCKDIGGATLQAAIAKAYDWWDDG